MANMSTRSNKVAVVMGASKGRVYWLLSSTTTAGRSL